ncbi:hypothetical protein [Candidatus Cytomitobacter primus]|uniref:Uncharacterized protein n=1 Tax=Candidatus Cytomitobacter primus TaxID=2066024 RepID=A0A5C0UEV1_9PROT|nr:hypothetical protein [Candidatus Cytomitobacter primus]QEK38625.1 hypothetical protein FZC34_01740 [Candidatus Cytomitobacter primus]
MAFSLIATRDTVEQQLPATGLPTVLTEETLLTLSHSLQDESPSPTTESSTTMVKNSKEDQHELSYPEDLTQKKDLHFEQVSTTSGDTVSASISYHTCSASNANDRQNSLTISSSSHHNGPPNRSGVAIGSDLEHQMRNYLYSEMHKIVSAELAGSKHDIVRESINKAKEEERNRCNIEIEKLKNKLKQISEEKEKDVRSIRRLANQKTQAMRWELCMHEIRSLMSDEIIARQSIDIDYTMEAQSTFQTYKHFITRIQMDCLLNQHEHELTKLKNEHTQELSEALNDKNQAVLAKESSVNYEQAKQKLLQGALDLAEQKVQEQADQINETQSQLIKSLTIKKAQFNLYANVYIGNRYVSSTTFTRNVPLVEVGQELPATINISKMSVVRMHVEKEAGDCIQFFFSKGEECCTGKDFACDLSGYASSFNPRVTPMINGRLEHDTVHFYMNTSSDAVLRNENPRLFKFKFDYDKVIHVLNVQKNSNSGG